MNPFEQKTQEIGTAFKTNVSTNWVRKTGRRNLVNKLLQTMRFAQSQEQFDRAAYEFKRQVLLPYYREVVHPNATPQEKQAFLSRNPLMQMQPRKSLGNYEELRKNPAFAESQYKMRLPGQPEDVPQLLRIAGDPVELDLASRKLGVAPEDLRDYIWDQYNEYARRQFQKDMAAAAMQGQAYRDSLANEYQESVLGKVLGTIAPEVTGLRLKQIREGRGDFDFTRDFLFGRMFPRNGKVDSEKASEAWELAKAIAKDAVVGIGSIYASKGAGLLTKNAPLQALIGGVADAGIELGRQGLSDYYDWDLRNAGLTGMISATLPGAVGWAASALGRIPGFRRLTNPIMRRLRGMVGDPATEEAERARQIWENAQRKIEARESGDLLAKESSIDEIENLMGSMEKNPAKVYDPSTLTREEVTDIIMDPERGAKYFTPPSAEQWTDEIMKRDFGKGAVSDNADEWIKRAKAQWPENYQSAGLGSGKKTAADWWADLAVDGFSRAETMKARSQGKKKEPNPSTPSAALQALLRNKPDLERMWKAGFAPNGSDNDPIVKLYKEWKEKIGG